MVKGLLLLSIRKPSTKRSPSTASSRGTVSLLFVSGPQPRLEPRSKSQLPTPTTSLSPTDLPLLGLFTPPLPPLLLYIKSQHRSFIMATVSDETEICAPCNRQFDGWDAYLKHKIISPRHPFTCVICGLEFQSENGQKSHELQVKFSFHSYILSHANNHSSMQLIRTLHALAVGRNLFVVAAMLTI